MIQPPKETLSASSLLDVEVRVKIIKGHVAVDHKGVGVQLADGFLHGIVLVPDFADQLLEDILHGHDALGPAIFVDDDRDVGLVGLQKLKQVVDLFRGENEDRLGHDFRDGLGRNAAAHVEILLVDHADDLIDVLFIHQQPGKVRLCEGLGDFLLGGLDADGLQIHAVG